MVIRPSSVLTEWVLGKNGCVGFNRLARSELVLRLDAEFVLLTRLEVLHHVIVLSAWDCARDLLPDIRSIFTLFDHVSYKNTTLKRFKTLLLIRMHLTDILDVVLSVDTVRPLLQERVLTLSQCRGHNNNRKNKTR